MKSPIHNPIPWARSRVGRPIAILVLAGLLITGTAPADVRYQVLKSFTGADGSQPHSGLVEGSDGALYGVTPFGGSNDVGTVFKLDKDGSGFTVLRQFSTNGVEGWNPYGRLIEASNGVLYGTTERGGSNQTGTVFKLLKHGGDYDEVFRHFGSRAGVIEGTNGWLYGYGRLGSQTPIFRIRKDGTGWGAGNFLLGVYFDEPEAHLEQGDDGGFYCASRENLGGVECYPAGAVWRIDATFSSFQSLHGFHDGPDCPAGIEGRSPMGGMIQGGDGRLYGTTSAGPAASGGLPAGAVFSLGKDGNNFVVLHSFSRNATDGGNPVGRLLEGRDGALYGTTRHGGSNTLGTVFSLNKDGSGYRTLHHFGGAVGDGARPEAGLIQGTDGALYGTTSEGGEFGHGTVFKLWPPPRMLQPVVAGGTVTLRIVDGPGLTNEVQRATTLNGTWQTLTNLVVPPNGVAELTDAAPPQPAAFYRIAWP